MYLDGIALSPDRQNLEPYVSELPFIQKWRDLRLNSPVTFFVGENGAGKSTLLEALAVNCGLSAEGGSRNTRFSTMDTHSGLWSCLRLERGVLRPKDSYFLRAESFYNVSTELTRLNRIGAPTLFQSYGGRPMHEQSHGESFLALIMNRFQGEGLYFLDEPEAALSPTRLLALLVRIHELLAQGSQFIIATHSPILMAYPGAELFAFDGGGVHRTAYEETEHYFITKRFMNDPQGMMEELLRSEEE